MWGLKVLALPKGSLPVKTTREPVAPCDPEADSAAELADLKNSFAGRAKAEADRFALATDSEYWCCLCFQSREQVEAFLAATGWASSDEKYIDGRVAAKALGVAIPADPTFGNVKVDAKLAALRKT